MVSELALDPQDSLEFKQAKAVRGIAYGYRSLLREAARYYAGQEPQTRQQLLRASVDYAKKITPPDAGKDELRQVAKARFETISSKHRLSQLGRQKSVQEALSQGGYKLPDDVLPTEEQRKAIARGQPWKLNRMQAVARLLDETEDPDARLRIFVGDANDDEKARLQALKDEEQHGPLDKSGWLVGTIEKLGAIGTGIRSAGASVLGDLQKFSPPPEIEERSIGEKAVDQALSGGIPNQPDWMPSLTSPMTAGLHTATQVIRGDRLGGVDIPGALSAAWDAGKLDDIALDALKAAWEGAKSPRAVPLTVPLQQAARNYKQAAAKQALEELGREAPREEIVKRARELYEEGVEQDVISWGVRNPLLAEVATDIGVDPLTYVAPLAAAVKLGKVIPGAEAAARGIKATTATARAKAGGMVREGVQALEKTPLGEDVVARARTAGNEIMKIGQTAQGVVEKFQHMPMMRRFQKKGDAAAEAASMARAAEARALVSGAEVQERAAKLLNVMRKVHGAEAKAKLDTYLRMDPAKAAEQMVAAGESPAMVAAENAGRQLGDLMFSNMEQARLDRKDWQGQIQRIHARDNYVPNLLNEAGELGHQGGGRSMAHRGRLLARGAHARKGDTPALADPVRQFEAKLRDEIPKAIKARQLVDTHHVMQSKGFAITVDKAGVDEALKRAQELSPGNEWVALASDDPGMQATYSRLTGNVGDKIGSQATIVPAEYKELIDTLMPVIHEGDPAFMRDVHRHAVRLLSIPSKHFRYFSTVPNYAFSFKNMLGAIGLSTITHGAEAFNPAFQSKAMLASFLAASGNPRARKWLEGMTWTMRNGQKVRMSKVIDAAANVGIMHQLDHRLAMDALAEGGRRSLFDAPVRAAEYLAEGKFLEQIGERVGGAGGELISAGAMLSPGAMAKMTENYQHFVTFLGSLEDLSSKGVAKALDITSDATGNYMRMGDWERGILRHLMGFYTWNRFILPRMAKEVWQNPGRLSAWAKSLGGLERWFAPDAPFSKEGVPNHLQAWGISAPRYAQLQQQIPGIGTHEYSMMLIENPLSMGYSLWPAIAGMLQLNPDTDFQRAADLLGPMAHLGLELITGRDVRTGDPLPPFFDFSSPAGFATSMAGKLGRAVYGRPWGAAQNIWTLYADKSLALDKVAEHHLRMTVGRDFLGLDNLAMRGLRAMGADVEPRSIGGPFDIQSGGTGVGLQYPVNPLIQHSYRHRTVTGLQVPRTRRAYEKLSPMLAPSE